jgi:hypothetical protein
MYPAWIRNALKAVHDKGGLFFGRLFGVPAFGLMVDRSLVMALQPVSRSNVVKLFTLPFSLRFKGLAF